MTIKLLLKDPNNFFFKIISLAVLGLRICEGFSLVVVNGGCSLGAMLRLLTGVFSPVAQHGPYSVLASVVAAPGL